MTPLTYEFDVVGVRLLCGYGIVLVCVIYIMFCLCGGWGVDIVIGAVANSQLSGGANVWRPHSCNHDGVCAP